MSGYLYFRSNLRYKRPYIGLLYDKLQNMFPGNGKPKLVVTRYILQ